MLSIGIDDLLSLSTTYWEPGLGPRTPRRSGADTEQAERGRHALHDRDDDDEDGLVFVQVCIKRLSNFHLEIFKIKSYPTMVFF